jgi:hypothetical protein
MSSASQSHPPREVSPQPIPPVVAEALARLRFGDIRLTIHEGRLVQVDVTERTRMATPDR